MKNKTETKKIKLSLNKEVISKLNKIAGGLYSPDVVAISYTLQRTICNYRCQ